MAAIGAHLTVRIGVKLALPNRKNCRAPDLCSLCISDGVVIDWRKMFIPECHSAAPRQAELARSPLSCNTEAQ
jgi:hypothetical protein